MPEQLHLVGGAPRKASQRHTRRRREPVAVPSWRVGDRVAWRGYAGTFLREIEGGQAELLIGERTRRVDCGELR
jgi:hypothetical protein